MIREQKVTDELRESLLEKSRDELSFWEPIAQAGRRGFGAHEFRDAAIHYKQYGLIAIGRDLTHLVNKTVVELCCGPTAIVSRCGASRAIGVDPLCDVYGRLWDMSRDQAEYITSEIETFQMEADSVDIVICWNGIDHVRDIQATIDKVSMILKDNGEFWTYTNLEDFSKKVEYKVNVDKGHQHQYFFNEISLDYFFARNGFDWITKSRYEPLKGFEFPPGIGGVLRKTNKHPSRRTLLRQQFQLRAFARTLFYNRFTRDRFV